MPPPRPLNLATLPPLDGSAPQSPLLPGIRPGNVPMAQPIQVPQPPPMHLLGIPQLPPLSPPPPLNMQQPTLQPPNVSKLYSQLNPPYQNAMRQYLAGYAADRLALEGGLRQPNAAELTPEQNAAKQVAERQARDAAYAQAGLPIPVGDMGLEQRAQYEADLAKMTLQDKAALGINEPSLNPPEKAKTYRAYAPYDRDAVGQYLTDLGEQPTQDMVDQIWKQVQGSIGPSFITDVDSAYKLYTLSHPAGGATQAAAVPSLAAPFQIPLPGATEGGGGNPTAEQLQAAGLPVSPPRAASGGPSLFDAGAAALTGGVLGMGVGSAVSRLGRGRGGALGAGVGLALDLAQDPAIAPYLNPTAVQVLQTALSALSVPADLVRAGIPQDATQLDPSWIGERVGEDLAQGQPVTAQSVFGDSATAKLLQDYQQTDPSLSVPERFQRALHQADQPYQDALAQISHEINQVEPSGGAAGVFRFLANATTDPLMWAAPEAGITKAGAAVAAGSALAGGGVGYGISRAQGASPEQTEQNVETGLGAGLLAPSAVGMATRGIRSLRGSRAPDAPLGPAAEPEAVVSSASASTEILGPGPATVEEATLLADQAPKVQDLIAANPDSAYLVTYTPDATAVKITSTVSQPTDSEHPLVLLGEDGNRYGLRGISRIQQGPTGAAIWANPLPDPLAPEPAAIEPAPAPAPVHEPAAAPIPGTTAADPMAELEATQAQELSRQQQTPPPEQLPPEEPPAAQGATVPEPPPQAPPAAALSPEQELAQLEAKRPLTEAETTRRNILRRQLEAQGKELPKPPKVTRTRATSPPAAPAEEAPPAPAVLNLGAVTREDVEAYRALSAKVKNGEPLTADDQAVMTAIENKLAPPTEAPAPEASAPAAQATEVLPPKVQAAKDVVESAKPKVKKSKKASESGPTTAGAVVPPAESPAATGPDLSTQTMAESGLPPDEVAHQAEVYEFSVGDYALSANQDYIERNVASGRVLVTRPKETSPEKWQAKKAWYEREVQRLGYQTDAWTSQSPGQFEMRVSKRGGGASPPPGPGAPGPGGAAQPGAGGTAPAARPDQPKRVKPSVHYSVGPDGIFRFKLTEPSGVKTFEFPVSQWDVADRNAQLTLLRQHLSDQGIAMTEPILTQLRAHVDMKIHDFQNPDLVKKARQVPPVGGAAPRVGEDAPTPSPERPLWYALKKASPLIIAGAFLGAGQLEKQEELSKTGQIQDVTNLPVVKEVLNASVGGVSAGDILRGMGWYQNHVSEPGAELISEVSEVALSKLLPVTSPNNGYFDLYQPYALQGLNLTVPNSTVDLINQLQKSTDLLTNRYEERSGRNQTLAFMMLLATDPLNFIGFGHGPISSSEAHAALNPISKEHGLWLNRASRASEARRLASAVQTTAYRQVGTLNEKPATVLERVQNKIVRGTATPDEVTLARVWGTQHEVNTTSVTELFQKLGATNPEITPELVQQVKERVTNKVRWTPEDLRWLQSKANFPTPPFGKKGPLQFKSVQNWATAHGMPDLDQAVLDSEGQTMQSFLAQTRSKVLALHPAGPSRMAEWLNKFPMASKLMTALSPLGQRYRQFTLPVTLLYITSPGWVVHAGLENAVRGFRGTESVGHAIQATGNALSKALTGRPLDPATYVDLASEREWFLNYYPQETLMGRGGLADTIFGKDALSESYLPGLARNEVLGNAVRAGAPMLSKEILEMPVTDAASAEAKKAAIQGALNSPVRKAALGAGNFVEHANLAAVHGLMAKMVHSMEGTARTYWISKEHPQVMLQVLDYLDQARGGRVYRSAYDQLQALLVKPAGISDKTWTMLRPRLLMTLQKGDPQAAIDSLIKGQIHRLNLTKDIFANTTLPFAAQSEIFAALHHATPEELTTFFQPGGGAEQVVRAALQFAHGNEIRPLINTILDAGKYDLRDPLGAEERRALMAASRNADLAVSMPATRQLESAANTLARNRRLTYNELETELEKFLHFGDNLWDWAHTNAYSLSSQEKGALYAQTRAVRQRVMDLQKGELRRARVMFDLEVQRRYGHGAMPKRVLELEDMLHDLRQGFLSAVDSLQTDFFDKHAVSSWKDHKEWNQVREQISKMRSQFYLDRGLLEDQKHLTIERFLREGSHPDIVFGDMGSAPPLREVPPELIQEGLKDLEGMRGKITSFVMNPTVPEAEQDLLRTWAAKTTESLARFPKDDLARLDEAHQATARIVSDRMSQHFIDGLHSTEFDEFARNVFPFWMYDVKGGLYYSWLLGHVPGFSASMEQYLQQSQGTGYLSGGLNPLGDQSGPGKTISDSVPLGLGHANDFGIFGTKVSFLRGLWPSRVLSQVHTFQQSQPKSVHEALNAAMASGIVGAHVNPIGEGIYNQLNNQNVNMPPPYQDLSDARAMAGQGFLPLESTFTQYRVQEELANKHIDPQKATDEERQAAESTVGLRDFAGSFAPRFTYTTPAQLQERKDFQDALRTLGFSQADQDAMKARGYSSWSLLNAQQKRALMDEHPDWQYIFEGANAFKSGAEQRQAEQISQYLQDTKKITQDRVTAQKADDARLQLDPSEKNSLTTAEWMTAHSKRGLVTATQHQDAIKYYQDAVNALDLQSKNRLLTPEDLAVQNYYTMYNQSVKTNTAENGQINWSAVNTDRKAYLSQLNPKILKYVQDDLNRNQTPVEIEFHQALDQLDQYDAIPRWVGLDPATLAERLKEEAAYTRLQRSSAQAAAAYRLSHPIVAMRLPQNPARFQMLVQSPLLRKWFIHNLKAEQIAQALTSNDLNQSNFGEPVAVPWRLSPGAGGPPGAASP